MLSFLPCCEADISLKITEMNWVQSMHTFYNNNKSDNTQADIPTSNKQQAKVVYVLLDDTTLVTFNSHFLIHNESEEKNLAASSGENS